MGLELQASIRSQRVLIWLSITLVILFTLSWIVCLRFFPPPPANLTAEQVDKLYSDHIVRFRIGTALGLLSAGCLLPLTAVISIQMARVEKGVPVWAILQALTGSVGAAFIMLPMLCWATAAFPDDRTPAITLVMHQFGWLTFVAAIGIYLIQMLGIAVVAFIKDESDSISAFPRWIGYLAAWQIVQDCGAPLAILFRSGIFSWAGLVPFWAPFALFGFWVGAMCFTMLRALRHQEQHVVSDYRPS